MANFGVAWDAQDFAGDQGFTALWERLVDTAVLHARPLLRSYEAEDILRARVAQTLDAEVENIGVDNEFRQLFLSWRFSDILSLNFDRALVGSMRQRPVYPSAFTMLRNAKDLNLKKQAWAPYFRPVGKKQKTRLWFPHGHSKSYKSIRLGVRQYGLLLGHLEESRRQQMAVESTLKRETDMPVDLRSADPKIVDMLPWPSLLCEAPLLLLGVGLCPDEWPLWWFLHTRRRQQARRGLDSPIYRLTCDEEHSSGSGRLAWRERSPVDLVELDGGPDWHTAWAKLTQVMEDSQHSAAPS